MLELGKTEYDYKNQGVLRDKLDFYAKLLWKMEFNYKVDYDNLEKDSIFTLAKITDYCDENKINECENKVFLDNDLRYKDYKELTIDAILLHELVHWYCKKKNLNYKDGEDDFENLLIKLQIPTTDGIKPIILKSDKDNYSPSDNIIHLNKCFVYYFLKLNS